MKSKTAMESPYILDETCDFAVVWKPPRMHCAPLRQGEGGTLLEWYAGIFPPVLALEGRKKGEGGLLHRLDFETRGLALFAKNQRALEFLNARQEEGQFVKEYHAVCLKPGGRAALPGFPQPPLPEISQGIFPAAPFGIESFFRPYGPGRKQVRPFVGEAAKRKAATDRGSFYRTEVCSVSGNTVYHFTLRLRRGFRHQIRCHLAWIGCPIVNDPLYGAAEGGFLALYAHTLFFPDPRLSKQREYRVLDPAEYCSEEHTVLELNG